MTGLKVRKIGNSLGVPFPKELLAELNVVEGDEFYLHRTEDGIELTPYDSQFAEEMAAYRYVTCRHRNTLKELSQ